MVAIGSIVTFVNDMGGSVESALRLVKVASQYCHLGKRYTGLVGFANAETVLRTLTAFQNVYRFVKAGKLFMDLRKAGAKSYAEGGLRFEAKNDDKRACQLHQVFTYLCPLSLAIVSATSFTQYLGIKNILPVSDGWRARLVTFNRYGGSYFGNGLAALSGAFAAHHQKRRADLEADAESRKWNNEAAASVFGSAKYVVDLAATGLENFFEKEGMVIFGVKAVSNHLAVFQSATKAWFKAAAAA